MLKNLSTGLKSIGPQPRDNMRDPPHGLAYTKFQLNRVLTVGGVIRKQTRPNFELQKH